jgi:hypothetical protein
MAELLPRVKALMVLAKSYDIGLNIDAEEADRLEISLDLLESLALDTDLGNWSGLGFVVQAYGRRCPFVLDYIIDLARRSNRRIMVRLVKGAYWDAEIKRAQLDGLEDFPVFTRKVHTDVSYIACCWPRGTSSSRSLPPTMRSRWRRSIISLAQTSKSATMSFSACMAWASRFTAKSSASRTLTAHAVSMRLSGRTKRSWPTSFVGCWKMAPTLPSSTALPIRMCPSILCWKTRSPW